MPITKDVPDRRTERRLLLLIVLLGIALRVYHIGYQSFWFDETVQSRLGSGSLMVAIKSVLDGVELMPPGSHVLFHFWLLLGKSEAWTRLLPALCGVVTIYIVYLLGKRLYGLAQGLVAAFLIAISPFHVWYSQEARPYSFLMLFSSLSMLYFVDFVRRGDRVSRVCYIAFTLCALYAHPYALFVLAVQFASVLVTRNNRSYVKPQLINWAIIVMLYTPWLAAMFTMLGLPAGRPERAGLEALPYTFYAYSFGFSVGPSVTDLHIKSQIHSFLPYLPLVLPFGLVFALLFVRGLSIRQMRDPSHWVLIVLWMFAPMLFVFAMSRFTGVNYNVRYACSSVPAFYLILASGVVALQQKRLRVLALAAVVLISGYSLSNHYFNPYYGKEGWREAAHYVKTHDAPGDFIVSPGLAAFEDYYQRINHGTAALFEIRTSNRKADEIPKVQNALKTGHYTRLWLILREEDADRKEAAALTAWLNGNHEFVGRKDFARLRVMQYRISPGGGGRNETGDE